MNTIAKSGRAVRILLVEDDEIDVITLKRSFQKMNIANPVIVAKNGLEALDILRGEAETTISRPYLILLDLNMPKMNGIEFLREIRSDDALRDSIVFVLTTSRAERDIARAYAFNVAGYIVKGDAAGSYSDAAQMIDQYLRSVDFP